MVKREIAPKIVKALSAYPVVCITGPRQSGKTTLCRMVRPRYAYLNLEDLSVRSFAQSDPKGFLETYKKGAIIDEIQYVPELLSYLQVYTDARRKNGEYIITGSQNLLLMQQISQSLAGRVGLFNLLPFSFKELRAGKQVLPDWEHFAFSGSFPRKWVNDIPATNFFDNYVRTYVERDVRLIRNINNLELFQRFMRLLAGRTGQLFNQSSLGNELGLDNKTIQSWMSILEASFVAFRLYPYHANFNKRLVKTPKVYFYDTGLLCYLLGIRNPKEMEIHFARGPLYENWVILELIRKAWNHKSYDRFYFWRDTSGNEIDLVIESGSQLKAVEIKSGKTIQTDFFKMLEQFKKMKPDCRICLAYGGAGLQNRSGLRVLGYDSIDKI
jgi:hypothetical protein